MRCKETATHGKSKTRTYGLWGAMIQRGKGNRAQSYVDLGVTVCDRWLNFEAFLADMGEAPDGHSLERVDNLRGYSPDNCKWIPIEDQWRNRRNTKLYEHRGQMLSIREIADDVGICRATLWHRVAKQGKTLQEAICAGGSGM